MKALVAEVSPPGGAVAIALPEQGPSAHLLVARASHLVTCPAPGMSYELPLITRAKVDEAWRKRETCRTGVSFGDQVARLCLRG